MNKRFAVFVVFAVCALILLAAPLVPVWATGYEAAPGRALLAPASQQSGAFTYQGRLVKNGVPVNGTCDASFYLYDASSGGFVIGSVFSPSLQVANGLFQIELNFGQNLFTGEGRWLETEIGCGADTPVVLAPRTALHPAPYAYALPGLRTYVANPDVTGRPTVNVIGGVISGTLGNAISADSYDSVIAGGDFNEISGANPYSAIGGGRLNAVDSTSPFAAIGGGYSNRVRGTTYGAIGGGSSNWIDGASDHGAIGGGAANHIENSSDHSTIGGGTSNRADGNSDNAVIAGGGSNVITGTSTNGAIGGGEFNRLEAYSDHGAIGGGNDNRIAGASHGAVGGGRSNRIVSGDYADIGGGRENVITASAQYAAIPGGYQAQARDFGQMAFASGGFGGKPGSAQYSVRVLRGVTPANGSTVELFADGAVRRITVPPQSAMTFFIQVVALTDDQWVGAWEIRGVIKNSGGGPFSQGCGAATCLPTAPFIQQLQFLPSGESATVEANNTFSALSVKATGNNSHPIRWVATVHLTEVAW